MRQWHDSDSAASKSQRSEPVIFKHSNSIFPFLPIIPSSYSKAEKENGTFCSTSLLSLCSHYSLAPPTFRVLISLISLSSFLRLSISVRNSRLKNRTHILSPAVSAIVTIIHFPLSACNSHLGILGSCFMTNVGDIVNSQNPVRPEPERPL